MGKLIFAGIVLVAGLAIYSALGRRADLFPAGVRLFAQRVTLVVALGVPVVILAFSILRIIPAGHVGVLVLFGRVEPEPLREGLRIVWNPLYDAEIMDTRVKKHTARCDAASKDLQAVHADMVLNYRVVPERAPEVYRSIGHGHSGVIIDSAAQEVLKAKSAEHNAAEILLERPAVKADVQRDLTAWLAKYGIELKEAALANIRFDPVYGKAVEAKPVEEQKAEQKRYELIQAQRQAEIGAAQAKGKGDAAREEAKGVADAIRIKGEAEAAYNARVAASLTPTLIQQQYLARWDGKLPQYVLGGNAVPFLQLPAPAGEAGRR